MFLLQSKSGWDAFTTCKFTEDCYKLRSFLRKLLLANCPSFTSQVRTDLMSTLHLQSHVSSLSQSWTNFLFTTAPCGKASFFFLFPSTYSFKFCWRCPWIHWVSGAFRHQTGRHSETRLSLQSRGQSLPPPQQSGLTTQLSHSRPILYGLCCGWPGKGTLSLEGPCTPRRNGTSQPLHFPSPFPLRETLCKQVKESQPQRNHGIKRHCPDCTNTTQVLENVTLGGTE